MRLTKYLLGAAVLASVIGWVAYDRYAPEGSTRTSQPAAFVMENNAPALMGDIHGADGFHQASGSVRIWTKADGTSVARFTHYEAADGRDVYLVLTREANATSQAAIDEGVRLHVAGGQGDGHATLRGDFNVDVPAGTDLSTLHGLTIWCEAYGRSFGGATLAPPPGA